MVEPKLLAFSALLGGISSYLLFRRTKVSARSRLNAEEAGKEQKRIQELLKYAEKMDKAYEEYLVGVGQAVAAREKKMEEYERQEKERRRKLEKRKMTGKHRRHSDASSLNSATSSQLSTLNDRTYIYDGLYYKTLGSSTEGEALEFTLCDFPFLDTAEEDKETRRKPLTHAVTEVEKVLVELCNVPVRLVVCPPDVNAELWEDDPEDDEVGKGKQETRKVGDLVRDTGYGALVYRQLMPKKITTSNATLLGYNATSSKEEHDRTSFLVDLLAALKPYKITFSTESPDTPTSLISVDPERCLVPAKKLPLVIAGAKAFRNQKRALENLEVGPCLPISLHCNSLYHFAFAEWRVKTLRIWYEGISGAAPGQPFQDTSGSRLLPTIMFDPSYGFLRMMAGIQADVPSAQPKEVGTEIILVVQDEIHIDSFREEIEWLASPMVPYQQLDADDVLDPVVRLQLFKDKVLYTVDTEARQTVRRVWGT
ncbi:hypothetical protein QFC21_002796 [Naganishia friedmannii]|uniref:Uncharacterized protein n=1 Tax=Naganishia friedmannii TaxID=89922 RepID=A0ACC2VTE3_9TREE|nr:hypothetical protein QFC21_002796 [Naganishia friedmannii]